MDGSTTDSASGFLGKAVGLATWNRLRSATELRRFIEVRHAALPADIDVE